MVASSLKIIHRYILSLLIRNLALALLVFVLLFLVFDFFDRIDNVLSEQASFFTIFQYFALKIPLILSLMLPVGAMAATLLTIGVLAKNSEITAMRATGLTIGFLARPVFVLGLTLSILLFVLSESIVPYSQRRGREIYNIDIRQKHKTGTYSQAEIWFRDRDNFYSVGAFDSRSDMLFDLTRLQMSPEFQVLRRTDAERAEWLTPDLGWSMHKVKELRFTPHGGIVQHEHDVVPLPLSKVPSDFYDVRTDPYSLSHKELRKFIKEQAAGGLSISAYLPYLYEKLSFPLFCLVAALVVLPFALRPARSGSMAASIVAALIIGFSYYAIHSFSIAMGKAEILPPLLSAWLANILLGFVGFVLMLGAEAP